MHRAHLEIPDCESYRCVHVQVSAGEVHTIALTTEGAVLSWGSNLQRQCGRDYDEPLLTSPGVVPLPLEDGERAVRIHAGGYRSVIVTNWGRMLTLGLGIEHEELLADEGDGGDEGDEKEEVERVRGRPPGEDYDVEPDNFDEEDEDEF